MKKCLTHSVFHFHSPHGQSLCSITPRIRLWKIMLKKAGYVQAGRRVARDCDGQENSILEVYIHGTRFGIRLPELYRVMAGIRSGRIEPVRKAADLYLCGMAGMVYISLSGKAVNIALNNGDLFTVSIRSLRSVLVHYGRYVPLYSIPQNGRSVSKEVFSRDTTSEQASLVC